MTTTISALAAVTTTLLVGTEPVPADNAAGSLTSKLTILQIAMGINQLGVFRQAAGIAAFPNNAFTKVTMDTVTVDNGQAGGVAAPWHSGSTFNGITAPVSGLYQVNGSVSYAAAAATTVCAVGFGVGSISNVVGENQVSNNAISGVSVALSGIISLTAGQVLSLFGFQNSGGTMNGVSANLSIFRVG